MSEDTEKTKEKAKRRQEREDIVKKIQELEREITHKNTVLDSLKGSLDEMNKAGKPDDPKS